jgi:hypothetical protein
VARSHHRSYLLDDSVALENVVVPEGWSDGELSYHFSTCCVLSFWEALEKQMAAGSYLSRLGWRFVEVRGQNFFGHRLKSVFGCLTH